MQFQEHLKQLNPPITYPFFLLKKNIKNPFVLLPTKLNFRSFFLNQKLIYEWYEFNQEKPIHFFNK